MTIVEPIPDLQWGKGSWQDYISNWRTKDANWVQERLILRYQTTAARTADWASPRNGQVTFNEVTKSLEMWRDTAWVRSLMFQYLASNQDTAAGVNLFHSGAGGKGIVVGPGTGAGLVTVDTPLNVLTGLMTVDATGLGLKVGAKTAKLSTDGTHLVSDSPFKAPALDIAGALAVGGALSAPSLTVPSATITTSLTLTGATVTGGILNATSGTIGNVGLAGGNVSAAAGSGGAGGGGFQSSAGYFYGDANGAVMRQRSTTAAIPGSAYAQVTTSEVILSGTLIHLASPTRVGSNRSLEYATAAGVKYGGPVIVQATDPGVANVPEGTIWIDI